MLKILLLITLNFANVLLKTTEVQSGSIEMLSDNKNSSAENYFLYAKANYQHKQKKYDQSMQTFQRLFDRNSSKETYKGYANLLFDAEQYEKIINLPESIKEKFEDDIDFQVITAQAYLFLNQDKKASELFEKLTNKNPDNEYVAYYTAVSYLKNNLLDKALAYIDKCLNNSKLNSKHFLFLFLKSKLFMQLGQPHKALEFAEKSIDIFPRFDKGWLFKALLSEQLGRVNDAIKGYQRFLDLTGRDLTIERQLVNLLFLQKRFDEAAGVLKKIPGDSPDYFFDLALLEWKGNNTEKALENINKCLEKTSGFRKAKLLKLELLLSLKQQNEALNFASEWIDQEPDDSGVIQTFMLLRNANVPASMMAEKLETLLKKHEKSLPIAAALADLYTEENNYKQAENTYKQLLKLTKNDGLKSKILFQLGYIYFTTNQKDKIEQTLIDAINEKNVYPSAYNLLAYHYAQTNQKLDKANEYIDKALQSNPQRFDYIDTKGYILLQLNNKKDAEKLFEQALKIAPKDNIIMQHLELARGKK
ncbi:MAG: tetratricopeptide repeat protein [bacterium]